MDLTVTILGALVLLPLLLGCWAVVALVSPLFQRLRDRLGWPRTADDDHWEESGPE